MQGRRFFEGFDIIVEDSSIKFYKILQVYVKKKRIQ